MCESARESSAIVTYIHHLHQRALRASSVQRPEEVSSPHDGRVGTCPKQTADRRRSARRALPRESDAGARTRRSTTLCFFLHHHLLLPDRRQSSGTPALSLRER